MSANGDTPLVPGCLTCGRPCEACTSLSEQDSPPPPTGRALPIALDCARIEFLVRLVETDEEPWDVIQRLSPELPRSLLFERVLDHVRSDRGRGESWVEWFDRTEGAT
jgi:hypothetical protein